jgi:hypothetical protein
MKTKEGLEQYQLPTLSLLLRQLVDKPVLAFNVYTNKVCRINVVPAANSVYRCATFNDLSIPVSQFPVTATYRFFARCGQRRKIFNVSYRFVAGGAKIRFVVVPWRQFL